MKQWSKMHLAPLIAGITLATFIFLAGVAFINLTTSEARNTRNQVIATHNSIAQLPQPIDIDIGVTSGSIQGQLNNYQSALDTYSNLSFKAPSHIRNWLANSLRLIFIKRPPVQPAALSRNYQEFVKSHTDTLKALEKTLTYNPAVDLEGLNPSEDEFKQRVQNAHTGFMNSRSSIQQTSLPTDISNDISAKLTELIDSSTSIEDADVWSTKVNAIQKDLRALLQKNWEVQLTRLSKDKQQLVSYYSNIYQ